MNEFPRPAFGARQDDGTVFAGINANDEFVYVLPREKGIRRVFNAVATAAHVRALNAANASGHADWREPTKEERDILKKNTRQVREAKQPAAMYIGFSKWELDKHLARIGALRFFDVRAVRSVPRPYEYTQACLEEKKRAHDRAIQHLLGRLQDGRDDGTDEKPAQPASPPAPETPDVTEERQERLRRRIGGRTFKPR